MLDLFVRVMLRKNIATMFYFLIVEAMKRLFEKNNT